MREGGPGGLRVAVGVGVAGGMLLSPEGVVITRNHQRGGGRARQGRRAHAHAPTTERPRPGGFPFAALVVLRPGGMDPRALAGPRVPVVITRACPTRAAVFFFAGPSNPWLLQAVQSPPRASAAAGRGRRHWSGLCGVGWGDGGMCPRRPSRQPTRGRKRGGGMGGLVLSRDGPPLLSLRPGVWCTRPARSTTPPPARQGTAWTCAYAPKAKGGGGGDFHLRKEGDLRILMGWSEQALFFPKKIVRCLGSSDVAYKGPIKCLAGAGCGWWECLAGCVWLGRRCWYRTKCSPTHSHSPKHTTHTTGQGKESPWWGTTERKGQ